MRLLKLSIIQVNFIYIFVFLMYQTQELLFIELLSPNNYLFLTEKSQI